MVPRGPWRGFHRGLLAGTWLLLLGGLALAVGAAIMPRFPGDLSIARNVQAVATPWLDAVMEAATVFGKTSVAVGTVLLTAAIFALVRRWPEVATFLGVLVLEAAVQVMKGVVERPRPSQELLRVVESGSSGSFPSGHVYHAVLFGGLLLAVLIPRIPGVWLRRTVTWLLLLWIVLTGVSRVYLGAHWPSDVLGSVTLGVPSVVLLVRLYRSRKGRNAASGKTGPLQ